MLPTRELRVWLCISLVRCSIFPVIRGKVNMFHSRNFLLLVNSITKINAQSRQYKRLENVWNMFKINNKDIRATSLTSFWCFYGAFGAIFHTSLQPICCGLWTSKCLLGGKLKLNPEPARKLVSQLPDCQAIF